MDIKTILLLCSVIHCTLCAYEDQQYKQEPQVQYRSQQPQPLYREAVAKTPPPRILSHKQAQSHDGGFKFAYTAENGQSHSEIIAPDGTRNGGYSYVDPHGKTITVKYTAGKDGFKILEGDHIPKDKPAPAPQAAQQAPSTSTQEQYTPTYQQSYQKPSFYQSPQLYQKVHAYQKPALYQNPTPQVYQKPIAHYDKPQAFYITQPKSVPYSQPPPAPRQYTQQPRNYAVPQVQESSNSVEQTKEPDYHDEPGKPYSFGVGYAFQFGSQ